VKRTIAPLAKVFLVFGCICFVACDKSGTSGGAAPSPAPQPAAIDPAEREQMKKDMHTLALNLNPTQFGNLPSGLNKMTWDWGGKDQLTDAIISRKIIVNWGAALPAKWWAYEKDAPIRGGIMIVNEDKSMVAKEVSADEAKRILGQ
jgi:hypothetical protein